ncbi:MAG: PEP-CTERM sorting domain-containing protein [Planctomycetota bacterium]|nr:PEP-CTERM sorting domain-containing protein [Planctomycetota bacterium]
MKLRFPSAVFLIVIGICIANTARAEILMEENFSLRPLNSGILGSAPNIDIDNGPNPNPNYPGGGEPPATLQSVYYNHGVNDWELKIDNFTYPFNPEIPDTGPTLKLQSDGGPNRVVVVPYQYTLQANDILRYTVRLTSNAGGSMPDDPNNSPGWNRFAFGFADKNQPAYYGFGNPIVIEDTILKHFAPAGEVNTPFPGDGYNPGQYDGFGEFHEVILQYTASKAGTAENAYQFYIDGAEFVLPIAGSNPALDRIGGIAFGNHQSGWGANDRYIQSWKLELIEEVAPPIEGDLDGDGFVGQSDLNLILGNWGQAVPPGDPMADPDGSGSVGQGDLNQVLSGWGQGTAPDVAPVPEPSTLVLCCLAIAGSLAFARRAKK